MRTLTKQLAFAAVLAFSTTSMVGCGLLGDEEAAEEKKDGEQKDGDKKDGDKKEDAKPAEIPAYAPEGDDAELKKEGAKDITADNAAEKAKEIEAALDKAIADAEAK